MRTVIEYSVGGASTHGPEMFWHEEGVLSPNPLVKRRGNLYVTAEGFPAECQAAIEAIRDRYYGDPDQPQGGNTAALRQALQAANLIIGRRSAIGVSVAAAMVSEWGQLSLLRAGDCQGFVYASRDSELLRLGDRQSADKALGRTSETQFVEIKRVLRDKDIVILCTGALLDGLSEEDIHSAAVLYAGEGAQIIAQRLVEKASLEENRGISTALVLICHGIREMESTAGLGVGGEEPGVRTQGTGPKGQGSTGALWGQGKGTGIMGQRTGDEGTGPRSPSPDPPAGFRPSFGLQDAGKMPFIAGAAAVFVAVLLLARPLLDGSSAGIPSAPSTAAYEIDAGEAQPVNVVGSTVAQPTLESPETVWAKVDSLWKKGEGGDVYAWQQTVSLLEQLQTRTPTDQGVGTRLGSAKTNLIYGQYMNEAANYWGTGDTKAASTTNWAKTVGTLEALLAYPLASPLSINQLNTARRTLYSARVNYGKALEDAKRKDDARIQYERARELDPKRPEAGDALKRLDR